MIREYRKKPIVIEAYQFTGGDENADLIQNWAKKYNVLIVWWFNHESLGIPTREGIMYADINDWIIKGVNNEFYPCKPDIFEKTYELVVEENENDKSK